MNSLSSRAAAVAAEQLLADLKIEKLPIDVIDIANQLKIPVIEKPDANAGVSGALMKIGNDFSIAYATHIESLGFQRFSIGHELGHLHLDGHADALLPANQAIHESRAGYQSNDSLEREADDFSANLLMPKSLFKTAMRKAGDGLSAILKLSDLCETSRLATAIRYANLTSEAMAVVVSEGSTLLYAFLSDEMKEFNELDWPRRNSPLPDVPTATFNKIRTNVYECIQTEGEATMQDWFEYQYPISLREEIVGLGHYGRTLTILSSDTLADEADEDADLEESWTPRFRR